MIFFGLGMYIQAGDVVFMYVVSVCLSPFFHWAAAHPVSPETVAFQLPRKGMEVGVNHDLFFRTAAAVPHEG